MKWLMALETNEDPITACRLMNVFRRKGVKIATLALAARPGGYSLITLVETPEADVEHIFNYLRRIEGVHNVTYYRHEPAGNASFLFFDSEEDASSVTRFLEAVPECKLVFASHGKYLLEIPAEKLARSASAAFGHPEFLPFARVRTSRSVPRPELVAARAS